MKISDMDIITVYLEIIEKQMKFLAVSLFGAMMSLSFGLRLSTHDQSEILPTVVNPIEKLKDNVNLDDISVPKISDIIDDKDTETVVE